MDFALSFFSLVPVGVSSATSSPLSTPESDLLFTISVLADGEGIDEDSIITTTEGRIYVCDITEKGQDAGIDSDYILSIFSLVP